MLFGSKKLTVAQVGCHRVSLPLVKKQGARKHQVNSLASEKDQCPSPQGDFALSCLGQGRGTQAFRSASGMQCRHMQSSRVSVTKLCHSASTKHAYKKGLQFFTVLASGKCINCKEKVMLGCISPPWAGPGAQIPSVPGKLLQLGSH